MGRNRVACGGGRCVRSGRRARAAEGHPGRGPRRTADYQICPCGATRCGSTACHGGPARGRACEADRSGLAPATARGGAFRCDAWARGPGCSRRAPNAGCPDSVGSGRFARSGCSGNARGHRPTADDERCCHVTGTVCGRLAHPDAPGSRDASADLTRDTLCGRPAVSDDFYGPDRSGPGRRTDGPDCSGRGWAATSPGHDRATIAGASCIHTDAPAPDGHESGGASVASASVVPGADQRPRSCPSPTQFDGPDRSRVRQARKPRTRDVRDVWEWRGFPGSPLPVRQDTCDRSTAAGLKPSIGVRHAAGERPGGILRRVSRGLA